MVFQWSNLNVIPSVARTPLLATVSSVAAMVGGFATAMVAVGVAAGAVGVVLEIVVYFYPSVVNSFYRMVSVL